MITVAQRLLATPLRLLACLLLVSMAGTQTVLAFGLGQISVRSHAGEALDASVVLYLAPRERDTRIEVAIDENLFAPRSATMRALLAQIDGRVEHYPDGYSVLRLRSPSPLALDRFSFRLRVAADGTAQSRIYDVALRAAPAARAVRRVVRDDAAASNATRRPSQRTAAPTVAAAINPDAGTYIVRSGDSLWKIAQRIASGADINATMRALHAGNPTAFSGGDIDRLKAGAVLRLPGAQIETAGAEASTTTAVAAAPRAIPETTRVPEVAEELAPSPTTDTFAELSQLDATGDTGATAEAASPAEAAATPAARSAIRDPALAQRLAAMDAKFAAIRAKYGDSAGAADTLRAETPASVTDTDASPVTEQAADIPLATAPARGDTAAPTRKPAKTAAVAKPARKAPAAAALAEDSGQSVWNPLVIGVCVVLLLVGLLWVRVQRRRALRRRQQAAHLAREADQRAAVAEKAGRNVTDRDPPVRAALTGTAVSELDGFDFSNTLDSLDDDAAGAVGATDLSLTQDEIDASIAHGRYQDAERLLLKVIDETPRNVQAKLRLAEVYYITERVEEFVALAEDLHHHHRADLTGDEWRRIMRMGKIIAPDMPLFSGPRAVSNG